MRGRIEHFSDSVQNMSVFCGHQQMAICLFKCAEFPHIGNYFQEWLRHQANSFRLSGLLRRQMEVSTILALNPHHWSSTASSCSTLKHLWVPSIGHPGLLSPTHSHNSKSHKWKWNSIWSFSSKKNLLLWHSSPKMELPIVNVTTEWSVKSSSKIYVG